MVPILADKIFVVSAEYIDAVPGNGKETAG